MNSLFPNFGCSHSFSFSGAEKLLSSYKPNKSSLPDKENKLECMGHYVPYFGTSMSRAL